MSDAWEEIQAIKNKRVSLRERLEKRKKERQDILGSSLSSSSPVNALEASITGTLKEELKTKATNEDEECVKADPELEYELLKVLCEVTLQIPISSTELAASLKITLNRHASHRAVCNLLQKFATQKLITVKDLIKDGKNIVEVSNVEHAKLNAMLAEETKAITDGQDSAKRKREESPDREDDDKKKKEKKDPKTEDIMVNLTNVRVSIILVLIITLFLVTFGYAFNKRKRK